MDFDLSVFLKKYWVVVLECALVAMAVAFVVALLITPRYEASVRMYVMPRQDALASGVAVNPKSVYAETQRDVILGNDVIEATVKKLQLDTTPAPAGFMQGIRKALFDALAFVRHGFIARPPAFEQAVSNVRAAASTRVLEDSNIVEIQVAWSDPVVAATVAKELADQYIKVSQEQAVAEAQTALDGIGENVRQAEDTLGAASAALVDFKTSRGLSADENTDQLPAKDRSRGVVLEKRVAAAESSLIYWNDEELTVKAGLLTKQDRIRLLGNASSPSYPAGPDRLLYALVGLLAGVLVGLIVALVLDFRNRTVFTVDDVESVVGEAIPAVSVGE